MTQQYETGRTLLGRYVIDGLLGAGGMGEVYTVHHAELARKRFALKTLRGELFGLADIEARFRREAEVLAALEHPGIVSIVDFGVEGTTPVMVMELLQGETLRDRLNRAGPMGPAEAQRVIHEVASALSYAHGANPPVVHRDLKPENLFLVAPDARVKVLDFGIAKVMGLKTGITQSSTALGTPNYMAPEQLRDSATVDARADQFALASIAYECLTAQLAYPGDGIGGVVLAIFDGKRPRVDAIRRDLPPSVDAVLTRTWSVEAQNRYADIRTFSEAFADALAGKAAATELQTVPSGRGMKPVATEAIAAPIGAIPPTRTPGSDNGLVAPSPPVPPTVVSSMPTHTPRASRLPIVLGAIVAVAAITTGGLFVAMKNKSPTTPIPSAVVTPAPTRPTEPSITGATRPTAEPTIAGNPTAAAANAGTGIPGLTPSTTPSPPRDVFETTRATLAEPIRQCGATQRTPRPVTVRITWNGAIGIPQNVAFEGSPPAAAVRSCIGSAIASYGRIPPQGQSTTRTFRFALQ